MRQQLLVLLFLFSTTGFAQTTYSGQTIEDILALPEAEIDLGIACLVLAKESDPETNIPFFLYTFDCLADRFHHFFGKYNDPENRVRALNSYLYQPGIWNDSLTFSYDDNDLHVTQPKNKFITGYLTSRKGSCITMPMLYLILSERLGFPIYPVRSAKHFFLRYIPDKSTFNFQENIETTNGGSYISDRQYVIDAGIPQKAIENGVYLRTLSKKEYLATLLSINATECASAGNIIKAKEYLEMAMQYDPTFSGAYWNYSLIHLREAEELEEKMLAEQYAELLAFQAVHHHKSVPVTEYKNEFQRFLDEHMPQPASFDTKTVEQNNIKRSSIELPPGVPAHIYGEYPPALQDVFRDILNTYAPKIQAKYNLYQQYKRKAEELGYVKDFPEEFFQKQSEILKLQQRGGK